MQAVPEKFDWEEWMPVIRKLAVLLISVAAAFGAGSVEQSANAELQTTEVTATETIRLKSILSEEYETINEMIKWHDRQAASCDTALEMYHGPDDWAKVVECCHSEGVIE
jgi:hypothetical protein